MRAFELSSFGMSTAALPNYFLADLPAEATVTAAMLAEACQTLKRNRERYLAPRSTQSMAGLVTALAREWLAPDFAFRKVLLEQGPAATGFSSATLAGGMDRFFSQLTPEAVQAFLQQELGDARRLEQFTAEPGPGSRSALVTAPELLVQYARAAVSNPTLLPEQVLKTMVLGLLTRSAQFITCPKGAGFLARLFAHSLYADDPKMGACIEIAEWNGNEALEAALFEQTDCVVASGDESALAGLRQRMPRSVRLVANEPRVSFAFIANGAMSVRQELEVVARAGADVVAWNQHGSLAPHVIYVEDGGSLTAEPFAQILSRELERLEEIEPRGELPARAEAEIRSRRAIYELRAADAAGTRIWCSKGSTAWTVVYEADPRFQRSCLNRFIYVKGVKNLTEALQSADSVGGTVSTVGLVAPENLAPELATQLGRWGATRVCPLGHMQNPPLCWRSNGRPSLGSLVTWTDLEK